MVIRNIRGKYRNWNSVQQDRSKCKTLKVKQGDLSFDECYMFSMRCPYASCDALFDKMAAYQQHHTQTHQLRDATGTARHPNYAVTLSVVTSDIAG